MKTQNENLLWADKLRALATFSVILLHVSAPILNQFKKVSAADWWIGNTFDSLVRFCVPIFLMLTGALMFSRKIEIKSFLQKRFSRIILPFIFWSIIYSLINFFNTTYYIDKLSLGEMGKFLFGQFRNGASFHLWYIYMLIGVYLIIPVINGWIINATRIEILYYLSIWIVALLINLPLFSWLSSNVDLSYVSGYLGFPILGHFLASKVESRGKLIPILLYVVGVSVTIFGTYLVTRQDGVFYSGFYKYMSPNVIIASVGVFLLFKNMNWNSMILTRITGIINKHSYGIYLSHVFVLLMLGKMGFNWAYINPLVGIPLTAFLCLIFSLAITYLISKVPYGNYISG